MIQPDHLLSADHYRQYHQCQLQSCCTILWLWLVRDELTNPPLVQFIHVFDSTVPTRATRLTHNNFTEMPAGSRTVRTSPRELVCQRMPPSTSKGQGLRGDRDPLCLPRRGTPTGRPQGSRGASGVQKKCHGDDHRVLINLR